MLSKKHNTHVLNVRMDIRDFASLVSAYREHVAPATAQGTYARMALEDMAKILVENGKARLFESTADAHEYIQSEGLRQQARSVRVASALLNELHAGERASELVSERHADASEADPKKTYTSEEILKMLETESEATNATNDV